MAAELTTYDYSIGLICAIPIELAAVLAVLDEIHPQLDTTDGDTNAYQYGRIGRHNVVISWLPSGKYGTTQASNVSARMRYTFKRLRFGLMIGVGGGAPSALNDIRLGDIAVSQPTRLSGGVIQYDFGKAMDNGEFVQIGSLNAPPGILLQAVSALKALNPRELGKSISDEAQKVEERDKRFHYPGKNADRLFPARYLHVISEEGQNKESEEEACKACNAADEITREEREGNHPYIHYGIIASGNQVMKDGVKRDTISKASGALCFEMEAAGLMDDFPCLVVRGICDYSDGHKNKQWQPYAALVAAIYAKQLLHSIPAVSKSNNENARAEPEKIENVNFVIPFSIQQPRNRTFIGRAEELRKIHKYFTQPTLMESADMESADMESQPTDTPSMFALAGTGGMGKTQIALEYAYRHQRDYTAIFWVFAASEDTIRAAFVDIMQRIVNEQVKVVWTGPPNYDVVASSLGIPGLINSNGVVSANPETIGNIQAALFSWLQLPGNSKWLLIFDNADDLETFDLQKYIPSHGGGAILITSRRPEFSHSAEQVGLEGLDEKNAIRLLLRLANLPDTPEVRKEAVTLTEKLGHMPLAISHAGCYMRETKVSFPEYLTHYDRAFITVQSRKPKFGWDYRNDTAATTWEISLSRVEERDKEAVSMLLACSYLNHEEISENLWEDEQSEKDIVNERVLLLASYSLVRVTRFRAFSVHPVVHSWARECRHQSESFRAIRHAITILAREIEQRGISSGSLRWGGGEGRMIASHLGYLHRYSKARFSMSVLQAGSRPKDQATVGHVHGVAGAFHDQGKYEEALEWYQRALDGYKALGDELPYTLGTINNIASVLNHQGRYQEALEWYQRALEGYKALGDEHPYTLGTIINNIASVFNRRGRYQEALEWYQRALDGKKKVLGDEHPSTLITAKNLRLLRQRISIL
ncbi:hypothetical protein ABW19_dt0209538 [Dactylella cylindrospora]|nr:hypothetical protein ABW19_dt0209538 [Dactylella cylindrospora]